MLSSHIINLFPFILQSNGYLIALTVTPMPIPINIRPTTKEIVARDLAKLGPTDDLQIKNTCIYITPWG